MVEGDRGEEIMAYNKKQVADRKKLNAQLLNALLDGPTTRLKQGRNTKQDPRGLMSKVLRKIEEDLDSGDEELRHKAIDKVLKLVPFVMPKEKAAPLIQFNDKRTLIAGKNTTVVAMAIGDYLKDREQKMIARENLEEGKVVKIELEGEDDGQGKVSKTGTLSTEQREPSHVLTEDDLEG